MRGTRCWGVMAVGVRIAFGWGTGIVWVLVRRLCKVPGVLYASKSRGTEYILFDSGKNACQVGYTLSDAVRTGNSQLMT